MKQPKPIQICAMISEKALHTLDHRKGRMARGDFIEEHMHRFTPVIEPPKRSRMKRVRTIIYMSESGCRAFDMRRGAVPRGVFLEMNVNRLPRPFKRRKRPEEE